MSAEELARIFDRFYRGERRGEDAEPGLGLGLPIAEALVGAQGGQLSVESDVEAGSVFTLALPLADSPTSG
jgi:signal transduction histidine kinase